MHLHSILLYLPALEIVPSVNSSLNILEFSVNVQELSCNVLEFNIREFKYFFRQFVFQYSGVFYQFHYTFSNRSRQIGISKLTLSGSSSFFNKSSHKRLYNTICTTSINLAFFQFLQIHYFVIVHFH